MSDAASAIMAAAEQRMRRGGFNGFSFREIAADVGVKSSSVHYHFPTKENLAAAAIQRYNAEQADLIERELQKEPNPVKVWVKAFRGTLHSEDRMCPCAVLGASSMDLPSEVSAEGKKIFKMRHETRVEDGRAGESWSPALEVSLELVLREFCFEITG